MPKKKERKNAVREKMGMILDMPLDMIKGCSRMTAIGNESILIENYGAIVEYEDTLIRLAHKINIFGNHLKIEEITDDDILIAGVIRSVEFED